MRVSEHFERRQKTSSVGVLGRSSTITGSFVTDLHSMESISRHDGHVSLGAAGAGERVGRYPRKTQEDGLFYIGEGGPEET